MTIEEGFLLQYNDAIKYINSITNLGAILGLERIKIMLEKLGNPQDHLKCIHVAGTNGKGSACTMLHSILCSAGYQTGLYTSPHLETYNERYIINGEMISDEAFADEVALMKKISDEMVAEGNGRPTVFEMLTAIAFHYFFLKKVDYLILEVGLGGRFDATNVIQKPLLSVIMSIGMDHMDFLGNSLDDIVIEKGGIVKENCPVVLYSQGSLVYNKIKSICKEKNADFYYVKNHHINIQVQNLKETVFSIDNPYFSYPHVTLRMLGDYQIQNCATVLLACSVLQKQGVFLTDNVICQGLKHAFWNGRMEICHENPLVILDGAHNVDGITMLASSVKHYFSDKKITLLLGVLGDKEYEKMVEEIVPLVDCIVLTEPLNDRKLTIDKLENAITHFHKPIYKNAKIEEAYQIAYHNTSLQDVILCCGSLYMIGEIRTYIRTTMMGGKMSD